MSEDAKKEALCFEFVKLSVSPPAIPEFYAKLVVSKMEELCLDLSNLIIDEAKDLVALCKEFTEMSVEDFNVEDYVSFSPEAQPTADYQEPRDVEGDGVAIDILDDE